MTLAPALDPSQGGALHTRGDCAHPWSSRSPPVISSSWREEEGTPCVIASCVTSDVFTFLTERSLVC